MKKLIPIGGKIIVEPNKGETVSEWGIVIPSNSQKISNVGKVLATGHGQYNPHTDSRVKMEISVGDEVLFPEHAGFAFKNGSQNLLILTENDILGILK